MMKFSRLFYALVVIVFSLAIVGIVLADKGDCGDPPNQPPKPAKEVAKEDVNVQNDYDQKVEETVAPGVYYLTFINGDTPIPNACGLNPKNDPAQWTGWGGPINGDNVTIGEGTTSRNEIVIGGVYFERGIGTHAAATIVYDLTGKDYIKFSGYVGMSDEKDPAECGAGGTCGFNFLIDGDLVFESPVLAGTEGGENVPPFLVEFDIPSDASELTIQITDGGDGNSCDHACLGDAKLLTMEYLAVDAHQKLPTTWAAIKQQ